MVYLRWPELGVELGLNDDGVVARDEFARLVMPDSAAVEILRAAQARADAVLEEAGRVLSEARAEADRLVAAGETQRRTSANLGYWQGHRQSVADWHRRSLAAQRGAAALLARQRERLADLVVATVRGLVMSQPPQHFYAAALPLLDKEAEHAGRMVFHVHPDDLAHAEAALQSHSARWPAGASARVEVDPQLGRLACRVESDVGYIDADLSTQLAALARGLLNDRTFPNVQEESCATPGH
ncbi:type III secretion system stator protein SctL [soil metagenome]